MTNTKDIREMDEEERQRAKERKRTRNEEFYRKNKIEQNYCLKSVSWLREQILNLRPSGSGYFNEINRLWVTLFVSP